MEKEINGTVKIKDIAERSGVSIATVSRALSGTGYVKSEKRELILKVAKELGYVKESATKPFQRELIGVVISDVAHPFFSKVLRGIMDIAEESDLGVVVLNGEEKSETEIKALQKLIDLKVKGIILHPSGILDDYGFSYLDEMKKMPVPVVFIEREAEILDGNGVFVDSGKGCYKAMELLIHEGHTNIAILAEPVKFRSSHERVKGCREAFADAGMEFKENLVFYGKDNSSQSGYELTQEILSLKERPTAIFATSNQMSIGCVKAIGSRNLRVPEDMAVVGFDDYKSSGMFYDFTAVRRHTRQMGEAAANLLIELMGKKKPGASKCIIMTPTLILRGSEKLPGYMEGKKEVR